MLEADAVERVVKLDIDAEIVAVELEFVAGGEPRLLVEIGDQGGDRSLYFDPPVAVAGGVGLVIDGDWRGGFGGGRGGFEHGTILRAADGWGWAL